MKDLDPQTQLLRIALGTLVRLAKQNSSNLVQGDIDDGEGGKWHLVFERQEVE